MVKYKALSNVYDLLDVLYFNRKQHSPRTALLSLIPDTPVRILDVCAGTGSNSLSIAQHKTRARITALDRSADMLRIAESKIRKANIGNVETIVADACSTGFDHESFDVVVLSLVLHEINEDLRNSFIKEAKRVLTNTGRIIVIEWEQPKKWFQRFMFSLIKAMEPGDFKDFQRTDLAVYFRTHGLSVAEKRNCDYTQVLMLSK